MKTTVTKDDLLDALRDALAKVPTGDGLTRRELAGMMGCSELQAIKALHKLNAEGRLEAVRVRRMALDGRLAVVSGYRIKRK